MGIDRKISVTHRGGIGRHVVTLLLLLAFALQSYLTQTHIHRTSDISRQNCISACIVHAPHQSSPFGEAGDCPLCQAIVHAGAFFAPAVLAVFVPHLWAESALPTAITGAHHFASARSGLSRAPPR
jgi:hypothetical protein